MCVCTCSCRDIEIVLHHKWSGSAQKFKYSSAKKPKETSSDLLIPANFLDIWVYGDLLKPVRTWGDLCRP